MSVDAENVVSSLEQLVNQAKSRLLAVSELELSDTRLPLELLVALQEVSHLLAETIPLLRLIRGHSTQQDNVRERLLGISASYHWISETIQGMPLELLEGGVFLSSPASGESTTFSQTISRLSLSLEEIGAAYVELLTDEMESSYSSRSFSSWSELDRLLAKDIADGAKELVNHLSDNISDMSLEMIRGAIRNIFRGMTASILEHLDEAMSEALDDFGERLQKRKLAYLPSVDQNWIRDNTSQLDDAIELIMNGGVAALSAATSLIEEAHIYYINFHTHRGATASWGLRATSYLGFGLDVELEAINRSSATLSQRVAAEIEFLLSVSPSEM